MRAGLLREIVVFKEPRMVQTATGAVSKEYVAVHRCRAYKKRFSNVTDKDKIDAKEEFYGHFGVLQVRYSPKINDRQIVEFQGVDYEIILLDRNITDNTYLVNVNKMNE